MAKICSKPFLVILLLKWARWNSWTTLETTKEAGGFECSQIGIDYSKILLHHHQPGVADVPGKGGHGVVLWVYDGLLQDVYWATLAGKKPLSPVQPLIGLGQ